MKLQDRWQEDENKFIKCAIAGRPVCKYSNYVSKVIKERGGRESIKHTYCLWSRVWAPAIFSANTLTQQI